VIEFVEYSTLGDLLTRKIIRISNQMASTAFPMASQLRSSFASSSTKRLAVPKDINIGTTVRISLAKRSFIIKAVQVKILFLVSSLH